jgi:hypothetical protein
MKIKTISRQGFARFYPRLAQVEAAVLAVLGWLLGF